MELISKEFDLHVYLGSFNGNLVRFYADSQSEEIYINLEDITQVTGTKPEHMTKKDFDKLKQSLTNTLKTNLCT